MGRFSEPGTEDFEKVAGALVIAGIFTFVPGRLMYQVAFGH